MPALKPTSDPDLALYELEGAVFKVRLFDAGRQSVDKFIVDEIWQRGEYFLDSLVIEPGAAIVDVGAHIGAFSVKARALFPESPILALEPVPANFALLRENLALNRCEAVTPLPLAVAGRPGTARIYLDPLNTALHSSAVRVSEESVEVEAVGLADLFARFALERVGLLKLDCEGGEYAIVLDAPSELWRRVAAVAIEYHPVAGRDSAEIKNRLVEHGFALRAHIDGYVPGQGTALFQRSSAIDLAAIRRKVNPPEAVRNLEHLRELIHSADCYSVVQRRFYDEIVPILRSLRDVPGDIAVAGVWRGGSSLYLQALNFALGLDRRLFLSDTFAGFVGADIQHDRDRRALELLAQEIRFHTDFPSPHDVAALFESFGLWRKNVTILEGPLQRGLRDPDIGALALVHIDVDFYEPTHAALELTYPKLSPGGCVVIDDYGVEMFNCRDAVEDFRREHGITEPVTMMTDLIAWWRKPRVRDPR